jgi:hypothetical protein
VCQAELSPGEERTLTGSLRLGTYRLRSPQSKSAAILEFQLAMLQDYALTDPAFAAIAEGMSAYDAWVDAIDAETVGYEVAGDDYFRARATDLKDIPLSEALDDQPSAPAWCDQDRQLLYVMRHSPVARSPGTSLSTLRRIRVDGSGDESVAAFTTTSVIAGPVVRGDSAWIKMSDGTLLRFDLKTKTMAESRAAGLCAPDALAVSPNGAQVATLRMDAAGTRSLVVLNKDAELTLLEFKAGEAAPRGMDFSPDGTRLVLDLVAADGKSDLALLTIATRTRAPLIENGATPVWHGR